MLFETYFFIIIKIQELTDLPQWLYSDLANFRPDILFRMVYKLGLDFFRYVPKHAYSYN